MPTISEKSSTKPPARVPRVTLGRRPQLAIATATTIAVSVALAGPGLWSSSDARNFAIAIFALELSLLGVTWRACARHEWMVGELDRMLSGAHLTGHGRPRPDTLDQTKIWIHQLRRDLAALAARCGASGSHVVTEVRLEPLLAALDVVEADPARGTELVRAVPIVTQAGAIQPWVQLLTRLGFFAGIVATFVGLIHFFGADASAAPAADGGAGYPDMPMAVALGQLRACIASSLIGYFALAVMPLLANIAEHAAAQVADRLEELRAETLRRLALIEAPLSVDLPQSTKDLVASIVASVSERGRQVEEPPASFPDVLVARLEAIVERQTRREAILQTIADHIGGAATSLEQSSRSLNTVGAEFATRLREAREGWEGALETWNETTRRFRSDATRLGGRLELAVSATVRSAETVERAVVSMTPAWEKRVAEMGEQLHGAVGQLVAASRESVEEMLSGMSDAVLGYDAQLREYTSTLSEQTRLHAEARAQLLELAAVIEHGGADLAAAIQEVARSNDASRELVAERLDGAASGVRRAAEAIDRGLAALDRALGDLARRDDAMRAALAGNGEPESAWSQLVALRDLLATISLADAARARRPA